MGKKSRKYKQISIPLSNSISLLYLGHEGAAPSQNRQMIPGRNVARTPREMRVHPADIAHGHPATRERMTSQLELPVQRRHLEKKDTCEL